MKNLHKKINKYLCKNKKAKLLYIGLYKNTTVLSEDAQLSNVIEPKGHGYKRIAIEQDSWIFLKSSAKYKEVKFTANGGTWGEVYGYFIATSVDNSGKLLAVGSFANGYTNVTDASNILIQFGVKLIG